MPKVYAPLGGKSRRVRMLMLAGLLLVAAGCTGQDPSAGGASAAPAVADTGRADDLLPVDCLLPGQIRQLGQQATYVTRPRPIKTWAQGCRIRGGEYVAYDRADYATALKVWLPLAQEGDKEAQTYVGDIYAKGLGVAPDHATAVEWYRRAAEQGYAPAGISLAYFYEKGLGVPRDPQAAVQWYRRASGLDVELAARTVEPIAPKIAEPPKPAPVATPEPAIAAASVPTIEVIDPELPAARGTAEVHLAPGVAQRVVVGKVSAPAGLFTLLVNDREEVVGNDGLFRTEVPVESSGTPVSIVAVDRNGKRASVSFTMKPEAVMVQKTPAPPPEALPPLRSVDFGDYHALVIGIDDYRRLPRLQAASADAKAISDVLASRYGFRVTTLLNANRYQILKELNTLRAQLTEHDNLLIYYAGHGELDRVNDRGYWLPVDAEPDSDANWISNVAITDILNLINAKHVLVVADSCYSGSLLMTRSALARLEQGLTPDARDARIKEAVTKRSRDALTSGGLEPVPDSSGGDHSLFAQAILDVLSKNTDVLATDELYRRIRDPVVYAAKSLRVPQEPQYSPIQFTRHEFGEFFFVAANAIAGRPLASAR